MDSSLTLESWNSHSETVWNSFDDPNSIDTLVFSDIPSELAPTSSVHEHVGFAYSSGPTSTHSVPTLDPLRSSFALIKTEGTDDLHYSDNESSTDSSLETSTTTEIVSTPNSGISTNPNSPYAGFDCQPPMFHPYEPQEVLSEGSYEGIKEEFINQSEVNEFSENSELLSQNIQVLAFPPVVHIHHHYETRSSSINNQNTFKNNGFESDPRFVDEDFASSDRDNTDDSPLPRSDHFKQVQDMIRQVNSSIDPTAKFSPKNRTVNGKKRARVETESDIQPTRTTSTQPQKKMKKGSTNTTQDTSSKSGETFLSASLPRDRLLTMSSEELDEYVNQLQNQRTLTASEMRELKRQRRLIKNREYAQASRSKKKSVLCDLGVKFQELEEERTELLLLVQELELENNDLRSKLGMAPVNRTTRLCDISLDIPAPKRRKLTDSAPLKNTSIKNSKLPTNITAVAAPLFAIILFAVFFVGIGNFNLPISSSSSFFLSNPISKTTPQIMNSLDPNQINLQQQLTLSTQQPSFDTFRRMNILSVSDSLGPDEGLFALNAVGPTLPSITMKDVLDYEKEFHGKEGHTHIDIDSTLNTKILTDEELKLIDENKLLSLLEPNTQLDQKTYQKITELVKKIQHLKNEKSQISV